MTDIEIAQSTLCPIAEIAEKAIPARRQAVRQQWQRSPRTFCGSRGRPRGKLILVTAVDTPAGRAKPYIGLAQALCRLGEKAIVTLREPSSGRCSA